ncbi:pyridine nucleotide-disulfide oxidoreductase [Nocardia tenerifensis]|uniref:Pyridine nucleotide-disulfide oxidoreductase n=1 Tax=Nocardia tenerifensis TaxID=228006 RepID=A0A318JRM3_9NOCA|nr:NAD(P)-binding domain-containing protein [Nocardia tenerifensis]PXX57606.1 pyridine nucleotide-disulfide oxidoreductase [Nocardia tenerifensis]
MSELDYLVIGAGPAGLQMGHHLKQAGRDYLIVEAGATAGTFFTRFPRHRQLISINKVHTGWDDPELNLRMDWNSLLAGAPFKEYTPRFFPAADDMVRYLGDFAARQGLSIRYDTRIERISRPDLFEAVDQHGNVFRAHRIIMATGVSKPYVPEIPGIETAELYSEVSIDPADFTDQRVLIIGKGNSAFETADNLIETTAVIHVAGPHSIRLAWQSHFLGHLRAVNNNFLDTYQLKSQNAILDGNVVDISRQSDSSYLVTVSFSRVNEVTKGIRYDRVIVATGFRFDASIFDPECRPELAINDRFPAQTPAWESVNVPGLYFAGTITQERDFKKSTSAFIHGFRYATRALHRVLEERHHGQAWPHRELVATAYGMGDAILDRVNRTSALWQLFGFLGDVVTLNTDGTARYWDELPVDFVPDAIAAGTLGEVDSYLVITLEYGADHDRLDPFDIDARRIAQSDSEHALDGRYLHPVVRRYRAGQQIAEHHITENLENEWTHETVHRKPLIDFLETMLPAPEPTR